MNIHWTTDTATHPIGGSHRESKCGDTSAPAPDPLFQQVMDRLDELSGLVRGELALYQQAAVPALGWQRAWKLSVVIPVYNERQTIGRVIARVAALPLDKELIIVDDCSTDGTRHLLSGLHDIANLKVVLHSHNQGKGAALRTGFQQVSGDIIVVQDADLEYDPRDIPGLIEPILRGDADIVYGSRFMGPQPQDKSWLHRAGNGLLTRASNLFSGLKLTDMETCYKAFHREALGCLNVVQNRFGIEPELTAKLARLGYRFAEVPISYRARGYKEGKKIGLKDLFKAVYCIGRYGTCD